MLTDMACSFMMVANRIRMYFSRSALAKPSKLDLPKVRQFTDPIRITEYSLTLQCLDLFVNKIK